MPSLMVHRLVLSYSKVGTLQRCEIYSSDWIDPAIQCRITFEYRKGLSAGSAGDHRQVVRPKACALTALVGGDLERESAKVS